MKSRGRAFGDDAVELDDEDMLENDDDELDGDIATVSTIGKGQDCCPF